MANVLLYFVKCCALAAVAVATCAAPAGAATAPCGPASARTLAMSDSARIYQVPTPEPRDAQMYSYGCLRGRRPVKLDDPDSDDLLATKLLPTKPAAVSGPWAAFALETRDSDGYTDATYLDVQLVDLRTGATRTSVGTLAYQETDFGSYGGSLTDLVLRPTGALAWIGGKRVIAFDARGNRKLDQRARPHSLKLDGRRITWTSRDGTPRRASLIGTPSSEDDDTARVAGARPPCGPPSARTLASSSDARLYEPRRYERHQWIMGCLRGGRSFPLELNDRGGVARPVVFRGRWVAWTNDGQELDEPATTFVDVVVADLKTGAIHTSYGTTVQEPGEGGYAPFVRQLVLTRSGAAAWTARSHNPPRLKLVRFDRTGSHVLDDRVEPNSLRGYGGNKIEWLSRDGTRHRATLRGTPPADGAARNRLAPAASAPCGPASAHTLAQDRTSRVYYIRPNPDPEFPPAVFACVRGLPRAVRLTYEGDEYGYEDVEQVIVSGRFVAYFVDGYFGEGLEDERWLELEIRDLRTGKLFAVDGYEEWFSTGDAGARPFTDFAFGPKGAVVAIGHGRVVRIDARGAKRVGTQARKRSLRVDGSRVTWRGKDGRRHATTLRGAPPFHAAAADH